VRGCCESHLHVIGMALERAYDRVLVVENDVDFIQNPCRYVDGPVGLPYDQLYLDGTLSRISFEEPTNMDPDTSIGLITVECCDSFRDVNDRIISSREDVIILTFEMSPQRVFELFGPDMCTNCYIVPTGYASQHRDVAQTRDPMTSLRFSKALYHRAKVAECYREVESRLTSASIISAIAVRLQEVVYVKAIEADTIPVLLDKAAWKVIGSLVSSRRMWVEAHMLSTHAYILRKNMFPHVISIIEANLAQPVGEILPIDVVTVGRVSTARLLGMCGNHG
jgi:hypothetical protein